MTLIMTGDNVIHLFFSSSQMI